MHAQFVFWPDVRLQKSHKICDSCMSSLLAQQQEAKESSRGCLQQRRSIPSSIEPIKKYYFEERHTSSSHSGTPSGSTEISWYFEQNTYSSNMILPWQLFRDNRPNERFMNNTDSFDIVYSLYCMFVCGAFLTFVNNILGFTTAKHIHKDIHSYMVSSSLALNYPFPTHTHKNLVVPLLGS